jgi:hypothetical protein
VLYNNFGKTKKNKTNIKKKKIKIEKKLNMPAKKSDQTKKTN